MICKYSVSCLSVLLMVFFSMRKPFSLMESHLFIFVFVAFSFGVKSKKSLPTLMSRSLPAMFSSRRFAGGMGLALGALGVPLGQLGESSGEVLLASHEGASGWSLECSQQEPCLEPSDVLICLFPSLLPAPPQAMGLSL